MKLRNKKTGESYETTMPIVFNIKTNGGGEHTVSCESITELNEKWEDVPEEPKEDGFGHIIRLLEAYNDVDSKAYPKEIIEKLKAWKRLKERHFKFDDYDILNQTATWLVSREYDQYKNDIKLLFGGEE